MDFDAVADELYTADPDDFVGARTVAVAAARQAGDRPLATRIGTLKKPTRSAWLVNLLAREGAEAADRLGALAERTAAAHQRADLPALRAVGTERQRLSDDLTRRALAAGAARGYTATEAVRGEVAGTLSSAVADPDVLALVRAGRVVKAQVYSGFGFPLLPQPMGATQSDDTSGPAASVTEGQAESEADGEGAQQQARQAAYQAARRTLAEATDGMVEARAALTAAEIADQEARQVLDRASQEVADLRAELRRAEQAEELARRTSTQAADDLHDARTALQHAEQAMAAAARALAAAE